VGTGFWKRACSNNSPGVILADADLHRRNNF
jgi:hypothetical protein